MKRIILNVCLFLCCGVMTAMAQTDGTFQFVDKDGHAIADGSTVTMNELTTDDFLGNFINSGLSVKNVSGEQACIRLVYHITAIDNGSFQVCFPVNCITQDAIGTFVTETGNIQPEAAVGLQSEWFPTAYGRCTTTYSIEVMGETGFAPKISYEKLADGPSVTVIFDYRDPASVTSPQCEALASTHCYDLQGRRLDRHAAKGLHIERRQDGRVVKLLTR